MSEKTIAFGLKNSVFVAQTTVQVEGFALVEPRQVHPLVLNEKDGSVLILVPAGEFEMGDGRNNDCPKHLVHLDGYYIGVYCVTNRQYDRFVKETGHRPPDHADYGQPVWQGGRCPADKLDHPVVWVSWEDAAAYAQWAGCELPTEAQWEKAARGPLGLIYPWGNEWEEGKCRNDKNKGDEQTALAWGYPAGVSGQGTYQQSGNVWEWCRDWYDEAYYTKAEAGRNPAGPDRRSIRVSRGGSWGGGVASDFRGAVRAGLDPGYRCDRLGFRLARAA
jgi:formylglycine-generating enzyme required for sulfatase activity